MKGFEGVKTESPASSLFPPAWLQNRELPTQDLAENIPVSSSMVKGPLVTHGQ